VQPLESITVEGHTYYESYPLRFNCISLGIALLSYAVKKIFCGHCEQGRLGCPAYEGMKGKGSKQ